MNPVNPHNRNNLHNNTQTEPEKSEPGLIKRCFNVVTSPVYSVGKAVADGIQKKAQSYVNTKLNEYTKDNEAFLTELAGKEALFTLKTLNTRLPNLFDAAVPGFLQWTVDNEKTKHSINEQLIIHVAASLSKKVFQQQIESHTKVSTQTFFTTLSAYLFLYLEAKFSEADKETLGHPELAKPEMFTEASIELIKDMLPEAGNIALIGFASSALDKILCDLYKASREEPKKTTLPDGIDEVIAHFVDTGIDNEINNMKEQDYSVGEWNFIFKPFKKLITSDVPMVEKIKGSLKKTVSGVLCKGISHALEETNTSNLKELAAVVLQKLESKNEEEASQEIYKLFIEKLENDPRVPAFIRPVLFSYIKEKALPEILFMKGTLKKVQSLKIPRGYDNLERTHLKEPLTRAAEIYADALYPSLQTALSSDKKKPFPEAFLKYAIKEAVLLVGDNFVRNANDTMTIEEFFNRVSVTFVKEFSHILNLCSEEHHLSPIQYGKALAKESNKLIERYLPFTGHFSAPLLSQLSDIFIMLTEASKRDSETLPQLKKLFPNGNLAKDIQQAVANIKIGKQMARLQEPYRLPCGNTVSFVFDERIREFLQHAATKYLGMSLTHYLTSLSNSDSSRDPVDLAVIDLHKLMSSHEKSADEIVARFFPWLVQKDRDAFSSYKAMARDLIPAVLEKIAPEMKTLALALTDDVDTMMKDPLKDLADFVELNAFSDRMVELALKKIPVLDELGVDLQRYLLKKGFLHIFANLYKVTFNEKPASYDELMEGILSKLISELSKSTPENFVDQFIKPFCPFAAIYFKQEIQSLVQEVVNKEIFSSEKMAIDELKKTLWGGEFPKPPYSSKEEAIRVYENDQNAAKVCDFIKGTSRALLSSVKKYVKNKEGEPEIQIAMETLEKEEAKWIWDAAERYINLLLLKTSVNILSNPNPAAKDKLIFNAFLKTINLFKKMPAFADLQKDEAWKPFVDNVFDTFFKDIEKSLPLPDTMTSALVSYAKNKALPDVLDAYRSRIFLYIDQNAKLKQDLNEISESNNLTRLCENVGQIWIRNKLPAILRNNKELISEKICEIIDSQYPEPVANEKRAVVERFFSLISGDQKDIDTLFKFFGLYTESLMLKICHDFIQKIKTYDRSSATSEIFEEVLKKTSKFYKEIGEIKGKKPSHSFAELIGELIKKEIFFNSAYPEKDGKPAIDMKELLAENFADLSERLVAFAGVDSGSDLPVPEEFKELTLGLIKENLMPQLLASIMNGSLDRKSIAENVLNLLEKIDRSYSEPALPKEDSEPKMNGNIKGFGDLVSKFMDQLTNLPVAPVLNLKLIKRNFDNILSELIDKDLLVNINNMTGALLDSWKNKYRFDSEGRIIEEVESKYTVEELEKRIRKLAPRVLTRGTKAKIHQTIKDFFVGIDNAIKEKIKETNSPRLEKIYKRFKWLVVDYFVKMVVIPFTVAFSYFPEALFIKILSLYFSYKTGQMLDNLNESIHKNVLLNMLYELLYTLEEMENQK